MEETRVPKENHQLVISHWQTLSHNVVSSTPRHVNPTTIRSWLWQSLIDYIIYLHKNDDKINMDSTEAHHLIQLIQRVMCMLAITWHLPSCCWFSFCSTITFHILISSETTWPIETLQKWYLESPLQQCLILFRSV